MEQQEEKSLKNYYANCVLRNKFGLSRELAEIVSKFMLNFYDKFFEDFDPEKAKHYRGAASNIMMNPRPNYTSKIEFYIGLMDKDTMSYHYTKEQAKEKVFEVLGDCTIERVPEDYQHNMSYKLKEIFNQSSILNVRNTCEIRYNNESEEDVKYIQSLMDGYNVSWESAEQAMNAGW